ncbi:hypothetical protein I6B53_03300 [Schaalia sp. 19OD2882]|uniref:CdiA C-terminal domain-containing protein n=1 Tax=Schaalia sp. 19OD2882 TaxID=2794089 RepID=UPI001C1ED99A|nr:hypothetical protein [Schaalia sp. 19OD2882]QWW20137.1 hypothetical protein I6B53_03300 [Schaalia sp. 19OD2882]
MPDVGRLDELAQVYDAQVHEIRSAVEAFGRAVWASLPYYRDSAIEEMIAAIVPRVRAGQLQTANLTRAYMVECARELGWKLALPPIDEEAVTGLRGVDPQAVYRRPGVQVWNGLSEGKPLDAAVRAGELRLIQLIGGDMQNAKRVQSRDSMRAMGGQYYRRILTGRENCALCVIASTQRYHVKDLLPIHPGCDCNVGPLPPELAMRQVIDEETLERAHQVVEARTGVSDRSGRLPDYRHLILETEHGEYGPVISFKETKAKSRKKAKKAERQGHKAEESAARRAGLGQVKIPRGLKVKAHEIATGETLAAAGIDVEFRPLSHEKGAKNPDAIIEGHVWEFKSPRGSSERNTISDQFKRGAKQADRLVIDLRRCGLSDEVALEQIRRRFFGRQKFVEIMVIDHAGELTRLTRTTSGGTL